MTNNNEFENCCKDTYPDKLELKENEDLCKGSFDPCNRNSLQEVYD